MEISYRWSESAIGLAIGPKLKRSFLLCNVSFITEKLRDVLCLRS